MHNPQSIPTVSGDVLKCVLNTIILSAKLDSCLPVTHWGENVCAVAYPPRFCYWWLSGTMAKESTAPIGRRKVQRASLLLYPWLWINARLDKFHNFRFTLKGFSSFHWTIDQSLSVSLKPIDQSSSWWMLIMLIANYLVFIKEEEEEEDLQPDLRIFFQKYFLF